MARELKAGDRLRMVGGMVEIESIETDKTQPVYNLDVARAPRLFRRNQGAVGPRLQLRAAGPRAVRPPARPGGAGAEWGSLVPDPDFSRSPSQHSQPLCNRSTSRRKAPCHGVHDSSR